MAKHRQYEQAKLLEAIAAPERTTVFRVTRGDDHGEIEANRAFRVQTNSAVFAYKGGPAVPPDRLRRSGQARRVREVFANALTTLALGGAKGGSDFDPKGLSDTEVANLANTGDARCRRCERAD